MPKCSVLGCSNRSGRKSATQKVIERKRKITFHAFPKNLKKRNAWLKAIGRIEWNPSRGSVLCSEHFSEDSFDRTSLVSVRLREYAIRSLALPTILTSAHTDSGNQHPVQVIEISPISIGGPSFQDVFSNQHQDTLIAIAESSAESLYNIQQRDPLDTDTALSKKLRTSVLSQSKSKQKHIRPISCSTSFSPLRRITRQLSPNESALLNKIKKMDQRYKMKIKLLQQRNRRNTKKIATMSSILRALKTKIYLQEIN